METVHIEWDWEEPICDDNKGHDKSEWGTASKEKAK